MVMVEEQFFDIMKRTIRNLDIIIEAYREAKRRGENVAKNGPYEFTQLVNSFLGAFALPREQDLGRKLAEVPLITAHDRLGFPSFRDEYPDYQPPANYRGKPLKPTNLDDLVRLSRNGILHGNFRLYEGPDGEIDRIQIWNKFQGQITWGTTMDVLTLEQLLRSFHTLATNLYVRARAGERGVVA